MKYALVLIDMVTTHSVATAVGKEECHEQQNNK